MAPSPPPALPSTKSWMGSTVPPSLPLPICFPTFSLPLLGLPLSPSPLVCLPPFFPPTCPLLPQCCRTGVSPPLAGSLPPPTPGGWGAPPRPSSWTTGPPPPPTTGGATPPAASTRATVTGATTGTIN